MEESQHVEFKESWKDEFLKHICAFANSQGGVLYVGIRDDGSVVGVNNSKKLLEDIPNKVVHLLGITVEIILKVENQAEIIQISVQPSAVPISFHSKYYIRSGSTVQELHGQKLREFILRKDNITWDEIAVESDEMLDIQEPLVQLFISKALNAKRLPDDASKNDIRTTLRKLNLIKEDGMLTRAAILLFGNRVHKFVKSSSVKIGRFGRSSSELVSQDVFEGNLLEMPDKIMDVLRVKYLRSIISYNGLDRIETLEYPEWHLEKHC